MALLDARFRRVLAGMCVEHAVDVCMHLIISTLAVACELVERDRAGLVVTLCSNKQLCDRTALLILRRMLIVQVTSAEPTGTEFHDLVDDVIKIAEES